MILSDPTAATNEEIRPSPELLHPWKSGTTMSNRLMNRLLQLLLYTLVIPTCTTAFIS